MPNRFHQDKRATIFRVAVITVIVVAVAGFGYVKWQNRQQGPDARDPLAQCLTDKGVKMYGAYWCPHCAAQKKDFGKAFAKVTYVECAIPGDTSTQTQACKDAGIQSYPTWVFPSGDRVSGEQTLSDLATKAGCTYQK